jgi:hypothetical protein
VYECGSPAHPHVPTCAPVTKPHHCGSKRGRANDLNLSAIFSYFGTLAWQAAARDELQPSLSPLGLPQRMQHLELRVDQLFKRGDIALLDGALNVSEGILHCCMVTPRRSSGNAKQWEQMP